MKKISLIFFICTFLLACKKTKMNNNSRDCSGLPGSTEIGANTFACKINGDNSIVQSSGIQKAFGYEPNQEIWFGGTDTVNNHYYIFMVYFYNGPREEKTYLLSDSLHVAVGVQTDYNRCAQTRDAITFFPTNGSITLTRVDTVNNILSGDFSFDLRDPPCDTLHVTCGRFDIKYP